MPAPQRAFAAEALPHRDDLYRTAVRLLHDRSRAADAVQETYLTAWKCFAHYEIGTNCRAWLFQILFHVVSYERRRWARWIVGKEGDIAHATLVAPEPIPDTLTDAEILAAIDRLAAPFRQVLLLVDVEEFSYKEAAAILHVPIGTVMSRLSRARAFLRDRLTAAAKSYGVATR